MRWRLFIIAWRDDLDVPAGYGFPTDGFITAKEAIGDLPSIAAGQEVSAYSGPPLGSYQIRMRERLSNELHNHYAAALSQANLDRLAIIKPGQDWRDPPHDMLPPGMQRALRKDHTRRFRRMTWDGVPRSVITRFRDPKSGEYIHPERTVIFRLQVEQHSGVAEGVRLHALQL